MTKGNVHKHITVKDRDTVREDQDESLPSSDDVDFKAEEVITTSTTSKQCNVSLTSPRSPLGPTPSKSIIKRSPMSTVLSLGGGNAARERTRVHQLKQAFDKLQKALPNVPEGTKLSKLDILLLATSHISHLMSKLSQGYVEEHLKRMNDKGVLHPIKKWPMRARLYVSDHKWEERTIPPTPSPSQQQQPTPENQKWSVTTTSNTPTTTNTANLPIPIVSTGYETFGDENVIPDNPVVGSGENWNIPGDLSDNYAWDGENFVDNGMISYSNWRKMYTPD